MSPRKQGTKDYKKTTFPDFTGYKAYVLSGAFYGDVVQLLAEAGFDRANSVADADVVFFIGGADINPALYGERKHPSTSYSVGRDTIEEAIYQRCVADKKPMIGICRGAQILHALNKGKLWQDVNNHAGLAHFIYDIEDDTRVLATSVHHQMLKDNDNLTVVAICEQDIATTFADGNVSFLRGCTKELEHNPLEIEAGCYLETGCFFVQGHPEIGNTLYKSWFLNKVYSFLADWNLAVADPSAELAKIEDKQTMEDLILSQVP